jgi:4a-hydroxytetrahydrobiopterin dehydratase
MPKLYAAAGLGRAGGQGTRIGVTWASVATLDDAEIERRLDGLTGWRREAGGSACIVRDWSFDDFASALAFVGRVGGAAEAAGHHPDILLHGWNKVRLTLSTHSEGGLTEADFALAATVGELA